MSDLGGKITESSARVMAEMARVHLQAGGTRQPAGMRRRQRQEEEQEVLVRVVLSAPAGGYGSRTAYPTLTYTVTLRGVQILTGAAPEVPRLLMAKHYAATRGTAYRDGTGWHLYQAFEWLYQKNCGSAA